MARAGRDEWERRFLTGLQEEWELARWELPRQSARALRAPGFQLADTTRLWGRWEGAPVRQIQLSRRLVWEHPWYAVVEVLRHEMAHQVAEEILKATGEAPHGPSFQRACGWLRVPPRASDTYPTLDQLLEGGDHVAENDRMVVRIRKLLALAESPNQHEAESALSKAQELMARHNVDLIERAQKRDYLSVRLGQAKKRHSRDAYVLAGILGEFYLVHPVWVPGYDPQLDKVGSVLEISGETTNVRLAHYVYDFVRQYCDRQWHGFARGRSLGQNARRDFTLGILTGFAEKLRQSSEHAPAEVRALVRSGDPELNRYLGERYPRLRTRRSTSLQCQTDLLEEGQRRGRDLTVHPGVERGKRTKRIGRGAE